MAFISGPRQVGKTTTSKAGETKTVYLSWDNQATRRSIVAGPDRVKSEFDLGDLAIKSSRIIFDEIHKYSKWKDFLKGYFDEYGQSFHTVVTGSARLNIYRRGGDSLMGRYFLYRMHPLSVAEIESPILSNKEISPPVPISEDAMKQLLLFGGFPEPFLKSNKRFYNRWKRMRIDQLFREDLRELTRIQEIGQMEVLAELLKYQTGQLVNVSNLANAVNVSADTVHRWIQTLESTYYCFSIRPWHANIPKSLRKQPKIFLWDWSLVDDMGAKHENFIASHLLKAVHLWTDCGLGEYGLFYLRDKNKREVDFVVVRNGWPWFLVEVKSSKSRLSPRLKYFQHKTGAKHAFQVEIKSPYVDEDCFSLTEPGRVPASTLLSQLV
ncbi:MAG: ATP-binding protein [Deltaproteobacteria bacterium]|nr:ATP-binding protein [Deltaproteobacteria bacterium]